MSLTITVEACCGDTIEETAKEAIKLAIKLGICVKFNFNGATILAFKNSNVGELVDGYRVDIEK